MPTPESWYGEAERIRARITLPDPNKPAEKGLLPDHRWCQADFIGPRGFYCTLDPDHTGRHEAWGMLASQGPIETWEPGEGRGRA